MHELECDHEEDDTRLALHAAHGSKYYPNIAVYSPDTDVAIILLGTSACLQSNVYLFTGTAKCQRIINITAMANSLGPDLCNAVIGFHAFTGCDSISAFFGKDKVRPWKQLLNHVSHENVYIFQDLGKQVPPIMPPLLQRANAFVCSLYGAKKSTHVNDARYELFNKRCPSDSQLPPNEDCLTQHILRANYQAAVHRRCLMQITISNRQWLENYR